MRNWLLFLNFSCVGFACGPASAPLTASTQPYFSARPEDSNALAVFAPRCGEAADLEAPLLTQAMLLGEAAQRVGLGMANVPAADLAGGLLRQERRGFLALLYTGHGSLDSFSRSQGCIHGSNGHPKSEFRFDDVVRDLPKALSGAVLVINACQSAFVDPREAWPLPVSVISASPFVVRTDSLFGHLLPEALEEAAGDPNCDGLVTDRELFERLIALLERRPPLSARPAYPKLRRNAASDIPLPIVPRHGAACASRFAGARKLILQSAAGWGEFGAALAQQLALVEHIATPERSTARDGAHPDVPKLPETQSDYFFIGTATEPAAVAQLEVAARAAGLKPLPVSARAHAARLAEFATFAEVYELSATCGWARLSSARDGKLLATREIEEIGGAVPQRRSDEYSPTPGSSNTLVRVVGFIPPSVELRPRPCYGAFGQCFEPPPRGSGGS